MAIDYDGKDLLQCHASIAIAIKEGIEGILDRSRKRISLRAINNAKRLFSISLDAVRE